MSDGKKYYCFCGSNCKYETMTKEQILAAIAQAAETGLVYDPDASVISKVKEANKGGSVTFWVGTQAEYNALAEKDAYCIPVITDSTKDAEIAAAFRRLEETCAAAEQVAASKVPQGYMETSYGGCSVAFLDDYLTNEIAKVEVGKMRTIRIEFTDGFDELGGLSCSAVVTLYKHAEYDGVVYGWARLVIHSVNYGTHFAHKNCYNGSWQALEWVT